jgi:hypothetical protein
MTPGTPTEDTVTYPKPCPVCGETDFAVEFENSVEGVTAYLVCMGCDKDLETRGPISEPCANEEAAEEAATRAWNESGPVEGDA